MLVSDWRLEGARPRRYYKISPEGTKILKRLEAEWRHMVQTMEQMIGGKND
jgi:DNA-binding PadR family transcriptional regulator